MRASIKIRIEDKERIDKLRAKLLLHGIRLSQEELLAKLIDLGEKELLQLVEKSSLPVSKKRKEEILSRGFDLPVIEVEEMDEILYGEPR
jgi:hypothetical protein